MKRKINMAILFQKYGKKPIIGKLRNIYLKLFVRSNAARVKYLRDAGAKIGNGVIVESLAIFGSEPWLIEVGNNTRFSGVNIRLLTHDGGIERLYHMGLTDKPNDCFGKVKIGSGCFIGLNSIIMKNVEIGDNCVIGAGSVVTKSIPANSIACGVPARVIGTTQDYCEKNRPQFERLTGSVYQKRCAIEGKMDVYESRIRKC